jgi:hypothetical protein
MGQYARPDARLYEVCYVLERAIKPNSKPKTGFLTAEMLDKGPNNGFPRKKALSPDSSAEDSDGHRRNTDIDLLSLGAPDCASHHRRFRPARGRPGRYDDLATRKVEEIRVRAIHLEIYDTDCRGYSLLDFSSDGVGSVDPQLLDYSPRGGNSLASLVQWRHRSTVWLKARLRELLFPSG